MRIVCPQDWRAFEGDVVSVVFEGSSDANVMGRLITAAEWEQVVAGRLTLDWADGVAPISLGLEVWTCALPVPPTMTGRAVAVFAEGRDTVVGAVGLVLGRSATAPVRRASPRSELVRWPVELAMSPLTTMRIFPGEHVEVPVEVVERSALFEKTFDAPLRASVCEAPADLEVTDSFRRDLCSGTELAGFTRLDEFMRWTSPSLYFLRIRNALVDVENGIVLDSGRRAWSDSAVATLSSATSLRRTTGWFEASGRLGLAPSVAPVRMKSRRPLVVFCHWATLVNHAHWVMNSLAAVFHLLPELRSRTVDLLCPPLSGEQRAELIWMGVPPEALIEVTARMVEADDVVFVSPLSTAANMHPPPSSTEFLQHLRAARPRSLTDTPRRVLFTRKGFTSGRRIANEEQVEAMLADLGFVAIAPHELSLAEEIDLVEQAEIIVAQLGAALTNIAFARPPTRVIELTSSNYTSNEYCKVASLLGLEYVRLMTEPEGGATDNAPFEFNVDLVALRHAVLSA